MALRCLLDIIDKFRCSKPSLLTFDITVFGRPANFTAESFEISFALSPLFLLDRVTKFTVRKFVPEAFNRCKVSTGDILNISEINKIATFLFCSGYLNKSIASELNMTTNVREYKVKISTPK